MQRSEAIGLGVAVAGHVVLFALLSLGFLLHEPEKPKQPAVSVTLVDKIALQAQAPQSVQPPAESRAPDPGPPEDAAAAAKQEAEKEPTPPARQPEPAPPPKPADKAPPPPKKPTPPKPDKAKTPPAREAAASGKANANAEGTGNSATSKKKRATGRESLAEVMNHIGITPTNSNSNVPQAKIMNAQALADITSAIARQIQPCADHQVIPGPGANEIAVKLNLRLNRDGTFAATPKMQGSPSGVNEDNGRYVQRVVDLGISAFRQCSPLKLPPEYYQTPAGGWSNINFTWQLKH